MFFVDIAPRADACPEVMSRPPRFARTVRPGESYKCKMIAGRGHLLVCSCPMVWLLLLSRPLPEVMSVRTFGNNKSE